MAVISAPDLVLAVGPTVVELLHRPRRGAEVNDVFLAEPGLPAAGSRGELVLGVGFAGAEATELVTRAAAAGAAGVVLRRPAAEDPGTRAAAAAHDLLLAALEPALPWAHVVWMLRGVLDRAAAPGSPVAGDAGVHNDLFVLADAAAAIVDAPVTIEDNRSRVLAYSSGQGLTDSARVSTIVGRRVPPEVVAHFRARGVFRRLARSSEPFLVPAGPEGTLPRLVVPVRAGDEWLGSIWAVVSGPVPEQVTAELVSAAAVLALHLLRLRAQADVARRTAIERVRSAIRHFTPDALAGLRLPPGPWRVVALTTPDGADPAQQLDLWAATCRRHAWTDPVLADLDGTLFAVVTDGAGPGSWRWLRRLVLDAHRDDPAVRAAAGAPADSVAELPRSRAQAAELAGVPPTGQGAAGEGAAGEGAALAFEDAWVPLTVHRATAALDLGGIGGPVARLAEHDARRGTAYASTLRAWLNHPGEPQRAAAALHVHVNTLRHRMKRLAEVVELDLADSTQRLALQLQLESLRRR